MEKYLVFEHLTISCYRDTIFIEIKGESRMPILSVFYGIIIRMYFLQSEHNPPHIHAIYNNDAAAINLDGEILDGYLPPKALSLVQEWVKLHKESLLEIWETQIFRKIPPLN